MSWLTEPDSEWDSPDNPSDYPEGEPKSRLKLVALVFGGWLVVSLVVLGVLLAVGGHHAASHTPQAGAGPATVTSTPAQSVAPAGPALPNGWTRRAADRQTDCAAHSYGQVRSFFASTPCSSVQRVLATTEAGGRPVVIASNIVTFDTPDQAQRYLKLVNADGTGNISDLLREGVSYPGGPSQLPDAAFASRADGNRVLVAEAGYVSGTSNGQDPTLDSIAAQAIR